MEEPSDRFLVVVARTVTDLNSRFPGQRVPLRRLVELIVEFARVTHDYDEASRLVVGFLQKPLGEQLPTQDRKSAFYAIVRTAGTEYRADAELIDQIARQFESENLRFGPSLTNGQLYEMQAHQDDIAVLALRRLV